MEKNKKKLRIPKPDFDLIKSIRQDIAKLKILNEVENKEKIKLYMEKITMLYKEIWIFAINNVRQALMEKNYKNILYLILNSKYSNVEKLVHIDNFTKILQSGILT